MSSAAATDTKESKFLPLRFALREMRGGLSGFYVFIACIALGVMAIAGVGSVAGSLGDGLAREGRVILGGDISFNLIGREASAAEKQFIAQRGRLSVAANMRAMTQAADGSSALVELKAVDATYPLYGALALEPALDLPAVLASRRLSVNARSPPRITRPSRASPSARPDATAPTPAIAMTPSAMQAMKT